MPDMQALGDTLAGAFGAPVNRPALNAYITQGQAMAGLRTAQTEDALMRAQQAREEMDAQDQLETSFAGMQGPDGKPMYTPSQAHAMMIEMKATHGSAKMAADAIRAAQQVQAAGTLGDPNQLNTPAQTAAAQQYGGKLAEPQAVGDQLVLQPGMTPREVQQTPVSQANIAEKTAGAGLKTAQATNPAAFHPGALTAGQIPPELQKAVSEGRLDPTRINSRTVNVLSQLAQGDPTLDFNAMHAGAQLQANANMQQKSWAMDVLPQTMAHMVALGKQVNYPDLQIAGVMQKWMLGQVNDPTLSEYMTVRNDTLMRLANVMRGVGMSDKAHEAEIEAAAPTKSPAALDGWLRGQMSTVQPMLDRMHSTMHPGQQPAVAAPQPAGQLPSYPNEAAALAAGHKPGDRVMVGGVTGTLQ